MGQIIEVIQRYEIPDIPNIDLPEEDGEPLESNWHRLQINLLDDNLRNYWRDRQDFFAGGNMFVYYSLQQVRNRDYKGPDFFVVKGVDGSYSRNKWVAWEENGRLPDVIVELMSPSTMDEDFGNKRKLYERTFHTSEYFCYDPDTHQLLGWRLSETSYIRIKPDPHGWLWSKELDAYIGLWDGEYHQTSARWLRLFDKAGQLIPTAAEAGYVLAEAERQRAEAEHLRAEAERQRAEAAEAELARLKAELARLKGK
ncbi:MAG: Uma2 family endonuclease [Caldilineaceae bacterium]